MRHISERAGQNRLHQNFLEYFFVSTDTTLTRPTTTSGFAALGVPESLVRVLADRDITTPTPIQTATLPDSLAGRDVLGRGRTGSGKT